LTQGIEYNILNCRILILSVMKSLVCTVLTFFILSVIDSSAQTVSSVQTTSNEISTLNLRLPQVIGLVLERHPQVMDAGESVLIADSRINQAKTGFLPTVNGTASYQYVAPIASPDIPFKLPDGSKPTLIFQPNNNININVGAAYTVFDFGRTDAQVATAQAQKLTGEDNIVFVKRTLAYSTVQAFYSVLFLQQSLSVQEAQIRDLNEALARTQKRIKEGTATEFDALTTQVRISNAESQKLDIQNSLKAQEITLRRMLGMSGNVPLSLQGSFEMTFTPQNIESLTAQALRDRIEVKTARDAQSVAQSVRDASYKPDLPSLGVSANVGFRNGIVGDGYTLNDLRFAYSAGAQISAPIFVPRNKVQQEEAELTVKSSEFKVRDAEQQVSADVQIALSGLEAASGKLITTQTQIAQAREAARRARARHTNGLVTNLELLDSELALSQAELLRLQAQYNYVLSVYALKRAVGEVIW
jgi:outer membrane protein TolC